MTVTQRKVDDNTRERMFTELRDSAGSHWSMSEQNENRTMRIGPLSNDVILFNPAYPTVFVSQSETSRAALVKAHWVVQQPRRSGTQFRYTSLFTGSGIVIPMDDLKTLRAARGGAGSMAKLGKYDSHIFAESRRLGLIERWGTQGKDAEQAALTQEGESALFLWHLVRGV